jgi:hypothetical protein
MIIRAEQMAVFERAAVRSFEQRLVARVREYFPKHFQILGEPVVREVVRGAWDRAKARGLTTERSVCLYLDLTCLLGHAFDTDPQMPWASEILEDPNDPDEAARMDRLENRAWEYVEGVEQERQELREGAGALRLKAAVRAICQRPDEELSGSSLSAFCDQSIQQLGTLCPQKCLCVGEECLRALVRQAVRAARPYGVTTARGLSLLILLMWLFGCGFDTDPQLPWASRILNDPVITGQAQRTDALLAGAVEALRQWWGVGAG